MKVYVLVERKTYGDGDVIAAVSTSERKIKKEFEKHILKAIDSGFVEDYKDDISFNSYCEDGDSYMLQIEEHETLK